MKFCEMKHSLAEAIYAKFKAGFGPFIVLSLAITEVLTLLPFKYSS